MTDPTYHAEQAAARFDDWASSYGKDRISPWFSYYQKMALSQLQLEPGSRFLDVGCGVGKAVAAAAGQIGDAKAVGVDISPKMIERAKALSAKPNIEFHVADSASLPFEEASYDAILCTFSFHHYLQPDHVLREIKRVLKPGGRFVIIDSARDVSLAIWLQDRGRRYLERSHVRYYTVSEMRALLKDAGWTLAHEISTIRKFLDHGKTFTGLMVAECTKPLIENAVN